MKFETKWKWFKRFLNLIAVAAGGLMFLSFFQQDLALFVAAFSLVIGVGAHLVIIGFVDAFLEDVDSFLKEEI